MTGARVHARSSSRRVAAAGTAAFLGAALVGLALGGAAPAQAYWSDTATGTSGPIQAATVPPPADPQCYVPGDLTHNSSTSQGFLVQWSAPTIPAGATLSRYQSDLEPSPNPPGATYDTGADRFPAGIGQIGAAETQRRFGNSASGASFSGTLQLQTEVGTWLSAPVRWSWTLSFTNIIIGWIFGGASCTPQ